MRNMKYIKKHRELCQQQLLELLTEVRGKVLDAALLPTLMKTL